MSIPVDNAFSVYHAAARLGRQEAVRRWIVSLVIFLYWLLIFEGALRKWGIPQLEQLFFFIRIPVTLVLYWFALYYCRWPRTSIPMLAFYVIAAMATLLVPIQLMVGEYGPRHMILAGYGWINYFFYIPLAFLIAGEFRQEDLQRIIRHTMWIALAAAPVVVLQFFSSPDSVINMGAAQDEQHQFRGLHAGQDIIRPSGFFTSSLGQQMFVAGAAAMALATFLQHKYLRPLNPLLLWLSTAAIVTMIMFSQSRGLFIVIGLILASAAVAGLITGKKRVVIRTIIWPTVLLVAVAVLWPLLFPSAFEAFVGRWTSAWRFETHIFQFGIFGRAFYTLYSFIYYLPDTPAIGYLLGLGGNAARQLEWVQMPQAAIEWQGYGAWAEFAWERHIVELGPLLGIAFIVLRIGLATWLATMAIRATRLSGDPLPLTLFGYAGVALLFRQITGQGTVNGFTWMFVGFCLAAARIAINNARTARAISNHGRKYEHA